MRDMQNLGVIHRDIKNANIFLSINEDLVKQGNYDPVFDHVSTSDIVDLIQSIFNKSNKMEDDSESYPGLSVKLGDFGFSTILEKEQMIKFYCGTPLNMAPEVLTDKFYNFRIDIWSLGVAIYESMFNITPFHG
jgi:serine/threonine protein kinase